MAFQELMRKIGGMFSRVSTDMTRRPDGGTSHYRPIRKKTAEPEAGGMQAPAGATQAVPYVHTGFTGMTPPAENPYDPTGFYGQTGWTRQAEPPAQPDYVGAGSFGGRTEFSPARRDNISYMPGFSPNSERAQVHVEHIVTITGLRSCYEAIEFMKDGETLIVMLDAIANESESIRCQDMLAGAAFTLGCSVRLLPGARIVLIAPEGVKILPEQQNMPEPVRPPEIMPAGAPPAAERPQPGRRERRTGTHAAEWEAARNGQLDGYNPYTGTMPVAAGYYGRFGGYGY